MLHENLKAARLAKGYSQEELAAKVNVVRQTISKWEKGLSVPDAEMLIVLARALDTTVSALLGEPDAIPQAEQTIRSLSEKLMALNEKLALAAERRRKTWRGISIAGFVLAGGYLLIKLFEIFLTGTLPRMSGETGIAVIGGADGPTSIFLSSPTLNVLGLALPLLAIAACIAGLCLTRRGKA